MTATNSAASRMYSAAAPASTTTSHSAACTTLLRGDHPQGADDHHGGDDAEGDVLRRPSATSCPSSRAPASSSGYSGTVSIHSPSLVLVVEQVGDAGLGVLVLRAPEQGVEGADLDADAAVHAQRVVDVEAVEGADRAGLAARRGAAAPSPCGPRCRCTSRGTTGRTACRPCSSPLRAMTPRARGGGASFSCGYCTVAGPLVDGVPELART